MDEKVLVLIKFKKSSSSNYKKVINLAKKLTNYIYNEDEEISILKVTKEEYINNTLLLRKIVILPEKNGQ